MKEQFKKLLPYMSNDESRYFMNGIFIDTDTMVSTDGKRLMLTDKDRTEHTGIIPSSICSILAEFDNILSINEKYSYFEIEHALFYAKNIDGQFPNYNRVIPEKQDYKMELPIAIKKDLETISKIETKTKRACIDIYHSHITVFNIDNDIEYKNSVNVDTGLSDSFLFYMNSEYILQIMNSFKNVSVSMEFTESNRAFTFNAIDGNDNYKIIIMPMKVED